MKKFFTNNIFTVLFVCLIFIFSSLSIASVLQQSLTFDEIVDLQDGREMLLYHTFSLDPYNPPLPKELTSLPYLFFQNFYSNPLLNIQYPLPGKMVSLFFAVGVLILVYFLTKKFFGGKEAILAAALLSFEPTFIANATLTTPDIFLTFFFLLSFFLFLSACKRRSVKTVLLLSISSGLGLVAKLSFLPFFISTMLVTGLYLFQKNFFIKIGKYKKLVAGGGVLSLLVVWSVYFFTLSPIIKQRQDTNRVSQKVIDFATTHNMPLVATIVKTSEKQKVPLGDYLAITKNTLLRKPPTQCFFLESFYSSCYPYFLSVNLLLKIPLPILLFFSVSVFLLIFRKEYRKKTVLFFIPLLCIYLPTSFSKMQPVVRYVLPLYPFLAILAASTWGLWQKNLPRQLIFAGLLTWYVGSAFATFPQFLSYANEFAGMPEHRFQLLTDSNLDWGQSLPDVRHFIKDKKPKQVQFSYFGRDNGDWYGLQSATRYMSFKSPEICAFHVVQTPYANGKTFTLISSSNWYSCGYKKQKQFAKNKIQGILGDTILIF